MQPARGVLLDQIGVAALGGFRRALGLGGLREIALLPIDLQRHQPAFRCRALVSVLRLPPEVDLGLPASRFVSALVFYPPALSRTPSCTLTTSVGAGAFLCLFMLSERRYGEEGG